MYALVQYEDNVFYVSKSKFITNDKGITKVRYSDGRKYAVYTVAKNGKLKYFMFRFYVIEYISGKIFFIVFFFFIDDKNMLLELKENILKNRPHILCKRLNFGNANNKKTDRINKNCDNKTNANNTVFCGKYI